MPAKPKPIKAVNEKLQLTLFFKKATDASQYLGCDPSVIAKVCKGKMESSWGWKFEFCSSEVPFVSTHQLQIPLTYEKEKVPWNKDKVGVYSDETKKRQREAKLGKIYSEETKKKMSESLLKYYANNDHHQKNTKLSEEHKQNIKDGVNNLPDEKKKEISEKLSIASKRFHNNLDPVRKTEINEKRRYSNMHTTYGQVKKACEQANLKPMFDLKDDSIILDILPDQDIQCFCGRVWKVYLNEIARGKVRSCGCQKSAPEMELYNFLIKELGFSQEEVLKNKRPDFMDGLELDLFIPSHNFAIEFHGLAFHSERLHDDKVGNRHPRSYHLNKFNLCDKAGVGLFQIFEDEWRLNSRIIKSMIRSRLKKSSNREFARKTEVKQLIDKLQIRRFFDNNHIAGHTYAPIAYGLFSESGNLLSAISFRKPFNKKYENCIEIARFATELDVQVIGGFSKLLKHAIADLKAKGYAQVLTYADLRFGKGKVYEAYGFTKIGRTQPNYFYESGGIREGRLEHKKNNDPEFIKKNGSTERDQNSNLGWFRIYDVGSEIYILDLK